MTTREYLESLQWDYKPRVAAFFTTYATGAENTERTSDIATKWFVSAVARAMTPGCNVDQSLVLCGPQGSGKTKLLRTLFGEKHTSMWSGYPPCFSTQWCVEVEKESPLFYGEGMFSTSDTYRPFHTSDIVTKLRTCVTAGTSEITLLSFNGGRRWIMTITSCASRSIEGDRDQLWAEAKHLFDSGVQWWD
jgi:predicted P-loop ATPase